MVAVICDKCTGEYFHVTSQRDAARAFAQMKEHEKVCEGGLKDELGNYYD